MEAVFGLFPDACVAFSYRSLSTNASPPFHFPSFGRTLQKTLHNLLTGDFLFCGTTGCVHIGTDTDRDVDPHGTVFRLQQYLAVNHQYHDDHRHVPDGFPHSKFPEPR